MPEIHINFTAVIIAVIATFILGFLWYTPLFGKAWAKEMGFDLSVKPKSGVMIRGMLLMVLGNLFLAYVLAHNMAAYNPVSWGQEAMEASPVSIAFMASFFTWLGFFLPVDLNTVAWEMKSWKLFTINTSYHFVSLFLTAVIIASMG